MPGLTFITPLQSLVNSILILLNRETALLCTGFEPSFFGLSHKNLSIGVVGPNNYSPWEKDDE
jgi:hypothetical protein